MASGGTVWLPGFVVVLVVDGAAAGAGAGAGFGGAFVVGGWPGSGGTGLAVVGGLVGPGAWVVVVTGCGRPWAPACQMTAAANAVAVVSTTPAARQRDLTLCRSPRLC
jgi:hypothetical protein